MVARSILEEKSSFDPALAAGRVVESAVDLARAEATLVLAHGRLVWVSTVGAVVAVMLATSAAQVALLVIALSPMLFPSASLATLLVTLLPSVSLTCLGAWLAFNAWRRLGSISRAGESQEQ